MRLLLIEDDYLLGDGIQAGLRQDGYSVDWFERGREAEEALGLENFDLMILDLGLPDCDGMHVLEEIRKREFDIPILILTARDGMDDRIGGLDSGADDYMVKPFDMKELSARIRVLVRRKRWRCNPMLSFGALVLNPAVHEVQFRGQKVELPPREFAVLETLMQNAGTVVTKSRLEESVYSWDHELSSNALEVHVHKLRKKINPQLIQTVRGQGYMLRNCT